MSYSPLNSEGVWVVHGAAPDPGGWSASVSAQEITMASSPERAQRGADLSGVSLVSFNTWPGADGTGVPDTVINDAFAHRFQANELDCMKVLAQFRRADELDAEAAYYGHRAMKEEQARGPGYFAGLLRALATDRATMAQQLRNMNEETR